MPNSKRQKQFARNQSLEAVLGNLNTSIRPAVLSEELPGLPTVFIVGVPRSGTTYCLQMLAHSGAFAYPSNLISRFWNAPYFGEATQRSILEGDEEFPAFIPDAIQETGFASQLGKTQGFLEPNEFWYFWRKIFASDGDIGIDLAASAPDTFKKFRSEIAAWSAMAQKPIAMKAIIANFEIDRVADSIANSCFLFVERDPIQTAWSLLKSRERMYGDQTQWFSFRTPHYEELILQSPHEQVVGQVLETQKELKKQFDSLSDARRIWVEYRQLCTDPARVLQELGEKLEAMGASFPANIAAPDCVEPRDVDIPASDYALLDEAAAQWRRVN